MQICAQNSKYFNVEVECTYSNHSTLKNYGPESIFLLTSHPFDKVQFNSIPLRCVIPVVCVTNAREENVVNQHN